MNVLKYRKIIHFNRVVAVLPSTIKDPFDVRIFTHELGHALGFVHVHEVDTLKELVKNIEQGLGCSVMGYNKELRSAINSCTTPEYCENQSYAIYPGPMDKEICKALYSFPSPSHSKYYQAVFLGFSRHRWKKRCPRS